MKYFDKKSALKSFYYLIAIDGRIVPEEIKKLDMIGHEIDPEAYADFREELLAECMSKIESLESTDDYSDIVQELIDAALDETEITDRISTRLVIWNMLVLAYSDDEYDESEKRLIKHIARLTEVDNSVLLEMEMILKAYGDVLQELEWLEQSERPYTEIRPHVEEIENRKQVLLRNAMELIADEVLAPIPEEILKAKKKQEEKEAFEGKIKVVTDVVQEKANDISEGAKKVLEDSVKPKAEAAGRKLKEDLKKSTGKFLNKLGSSLQKLGDSKSDKGGEE